MRREFLTTVGLGLMIAAANNLPAFSQLEVPSIPVRAQMTAPVQQNKKSRSHVSELPARHRLAPKPIQTAPITAGGRRGNLHPAVTRSLTHHTAVKASNRIAKSPISNFLVPPPPPYTPSISAADYPSAYPNIGANSYSNANANAGASDASSQYAARPVKHSKSTRLRRPGRNQTAYDYKGQKLKKGSLKHRVCSVVAKPFKFLCHRFGHSHRQTPA